jgi:SP family sugar:H+ symporter-like MFS transporter
MAANTTGAGVLGDRSKMHNERHSGDSSMRDMEKKPQMLSGGAKQIFRPRIIAMAIIVSMGGFSKHLFLWL